MKKITILSIIVMFCLKANAQSKYFEKSTGWSDIQDGRKIRVLDTESYLIFGQYSPLENFRASAHSILLNRYGDTVAVNKYVIENYQVFINDIAVFEDKTIVTGCLEGEEYRCVGCIFSVSDIGEMLNWQIIGDSHIHNILRTVTPTSDFNFLVGGHIFNELNYWKPYLIKIDLEGNKLWERTYNFNSNTNHSIHDILLAEEGGYYLTGVRNLNWAASPSTGDIFLMKIDEEGEEEWIRNYNFGTVDQAGEFLQTQDRGFIITAKTDEHTASIIKLDASFNLEWIKEDIVEDGSPSGIVELADGNYVVSAFTRIEGVDKRLEGKIIKLDQEGNILWERQYGGDRNDYFYDIRQTTDNGFILSGRTESGLTPPAANVYLVKTNCMGLLTEPLASFSAEQDPEHELTYHFTNYSEFVYPDSIDGGHFIWDFGDGTTSNELHPTHEYADKGETYVVTLTAVVCSDTSRWEVKVVAGNEIVNIEELEGVLPAFSFKLYPNPAIGGEVVLEYDLPREGVLELFDLQGKLINNYQLSINNSGRVFDIRYLKAGLYVYRLSLEGRTLEDGKLVVE